MFLQKIKKKTIDVGTFLMVKKSY